MVYYVDILCCGWAGDWLIGRLVVRLVVRLDVIVDSNDVAI